MWRGRFVPRFVCAHHPLFPVKRLTCKSFSKKPLTRRDLRTKIHSAKMNGFTSIWLATNFDAPILRHRQKLYPPTTCYRAFPKCLPPLDGCRHSRQTQNTEPAAGTVLAHWSNSSRATRYRVFKQIDGVDAIPVNLKHRHRQRRHADGAAQRQDVESLCHRRQRRRPSRAERHGDNRRAVNVTVPA